jgi:hypothetical protein
MSRFTYDGLGTDRRSRYVPGTELGYSPIRSNRLVGSGIKLQWGFIHAANVRTDSNHVGYLYTACPDLRLGVPLHRYRCKVFPKSQVGASIVADVVTVGPVDYFCSELLEPKAVRTDSNHVS